MMKVVLFEWLTGGGLWYDQRLPGFKNSMQQQGFEMWGALGQDLVSAGVQVISPVDRRLLDGVSPCAHGVQIHAIGSAQQLRQTLTEGSLETEYCLLIAPECDGRLLDCARWSGEADRELISPGTEFIELASCKSKTFTHFQNHGFNSVPKGGPLVRFQANDEPSFELDFPVVVKPSDGAGSEGVRLIQNASALAALKLDNASEEALHLAHLRVESYVSGTPVSVAVIGGPVNQILMPMRQVFDAEPFGEFVEAQPSLPTAVADRAIQLAIDAVTALPKTNGYFGIDMVISDQNPSLDCVIEVNPRLTMSYLALRKVYRENLAQLMFPSISDAPFESKGTLPVDQAIKPNCIYREPTP